MAPLWMVLVVVCGQQAPTTEAVRASMMAPPGMEVALVASDPLVRSPVAGVFDARGRLWVVEMETNASGSVATWAWRGHRNIPVWPTVDGACVDISYTPS